MGAPINLLDAALDTFRDDDGSDADATDEMKYNIGWYLGNVFK